ncbi:PREDICTED: uncharacterized protein LOC105562895 isoform X2 [Vollenhovia emeryi]|uniref:uncharacterized protein LOC105562895 isoform X2 n=1 Tax=Vollenhovia emeryi TaxID=411798 RepID=UPI0005F49AE7|nr:PREDICTED: uncharacterized protein LOC105562895 isoform X2 [Vollenhovia emeryi]
MCARQVTIASAMSTSNRSDLSDTTISNEIEPMIYKANLILHSGILKHLSNLKRYGDATLNYKDQVLRLDVGFEFTLLQGTYDFIVDVVFVNLKGRILVSAANVRAKIIITYNSMNHILSLDKFELQVPGSIKVIIENKNGGVDWINTFIANIVTPFFKNTIVSSVQEEAANAIRAHFDEISQAIVEGKLVTPVFEYGSTKA